jgi:hypothetical protein
VLLAALSQSDLWRDLLEVCTTIAATGAAGSLLVGLLEVARSTWQQREGRFGEAVAYGFILGAAGGGAVELFARLGVA